MGSGPIHRDGTAALRDSFDETWAAFRAFPHTATLRPADRERWRRGRCRYSAWVFRLDAPEVRQRVARVREALGARLDPLADADLHLTVWVVGFLDGPGQGSAPEGWLDDDASPELIEAQAQALGQLPAPRLALAGANAFRGCAVLEVAPLDGGLDALRAAICEVSGPELRFARFLPHATVGHFPSHHPTAPIARQLAPLRRLPEVPMNPTYIEQVEIDARLARAPLRTLRRLRLHASGEAP